MRLRVRSIPISCIFLVFEFCVETINGDGHLSVNGINMPTGDDCCKEASSSESRLESAMREPIPYYLQSADE